jgi:hypothetical protein
VVEDRSGQLPQDPGQKRRRDNMFALMAMLGGCFFLVNVLWATGFIVFVPIVVGITLYAVIARLFFRVFNVDVGPMGLPARPQDGTVTTGPEEDEASLTPTAESSAPPGKT